MSVALEPIIPGVVAEEIDGRVPEKVVNRSGRRLAPSIRADQEWLGRPFEEGPSYY